MAAPWVGLNECAEFSIAHPGTAFTAFDEVTGGRMGVAGGGIEYDVGAGGQASKWRGMFHGAGNVNCLLQSAGLLTRLKPAALGSLPPIIDMIHGGPVAETNGAWIHNHSYLTKVAVGCDQGKTLTVGYEWVSLIPTRGTIAAAVAKITNLVFPWHKQTILFNTIAYKCIGWNAEFTTGITPQSSSDLKTATVQRRVEWIDPGTFEGKVTARLRIPMAQTNDFLADFVDVFTFSVVALNNDGTAKTFTLDMTGGEGIDLADGMPTEITKGPDGVVYEISGSILPNDLAAVVIGVAP
jgi:hypothetical protein